MYRPICLSAMGCEAALEHATSAMSGKPRRPFLLPVPGSSRTSEASPVRFNKH
ncbi:hypothetical protein ALQ59_04583 [Pseudomonas syringae pv. apii]|nr:hypothetical protein ALQ59_04583 [Pseudomonas syringae pv. apii]RMN45829.1 hypothetical protein ALQ58_05237 [Pseudomonas syringae pv. apii]